VRVLEHVEVDPGLVEKARHVCHRSPFASIIRSADRHDPPVRAALIGALSRRPK
jgi:hypothetical protein